jgi:RNA-directed DNA polymerase
MTWQDYEADLELRIEDLHGRVHRGAYRSQPASFADAPAFAFAGK